MKPKYADTGKEVTLIKLTAGLLMYLEYSHTVIIIFSRDSRVQISVVGSWGPGSSLALTSARFRTMCYGEFRREKQAIESRVNFESLEWIDVKKAIFGIASVVW